MTKKYIGANIIICDSRTENVEELMCEADVIISATGKRHIVKGEFIKAGAIILDLGSNNAIKG